MATSMNYSVVARKNPSKKSEPAKYYALAQASGELDFDEMCEAITGRTTCTETDVRAALAGIIYEAKRALKAGRIVRLGDLGSMQMGVSSEGAEKAEDFTISMIKKSRINFRPGKGLTDAARFAVGGRATATATTRRSIALGFRRSACRGNDLMGALGTPVVAVEAAWWRRSG